MRFSTILFDLDNTLYPSACGLWPQIKARINDYMTEVMGLTPQEVPELREQYWRQYGTTLRGLQKHHQVDVYEYLAYVHDVPLSGVLTSSSALRDMLLSLPQKRWIFTNADAPHAQRVITQLGLDGCFEGIVDIHATRYACKPEVEAYTLALQVAGENDPTRCVMLDDAIHNLTPAHQLGMTTILIAEEQREVAGVDLTIRRVEDLPQALPELWQGRACAWGLE